jgi:hypothetical protein
MHWRIVAILAAAAFGAAGCGRAGAANGAASASVTAAASASAGNACDRHLVTRNDVAAILRDPITTMKSLGADGDAQACEFETAGFASVTISLRPGLGNATVDAWASGRMPLHAEALAGVGDRAAWCGDLKEVIATKNNVLCDVGVGGPPGASVSSEVVKQRLGDLCNKIFAK